MNETELVKVLTQLLSQGGTLALWGLIAFQTLSIIKSSIIWIFAFSTVKCLTGAISSLIKWGIENDLRTIQEKVSKIN